MKLSDPVAEVSYDLAIHFILSKTMLQRRFDHLTAVLVARAMSAVISEELSEEEEIFDQIRDDYKEIERLSGELREASFAQEHLLRQFRHIRNPGYEVEPKAQSSLTTYPLKCGSEQCARAKFVPVSSRKEFIQ